MAHSVSTFVYGQHLVAREKRYFEDEGVSVPSLSVPGGGARVVNALTAGQAMFGLGDSNHPLPEWQFAAETEGFGRPIYDVLDEQAWDRVFGGPIPVTVGYTLRETLEKSADLAQAYVNACYRAQQWIRRPKDEEVLDLLHKP